jgi:hypothetical protein
MPDLIRPELKLNKTDMSGGKLYGYTNYDGIPRQVKNIFLSVDINNIWLDHPNSWYEYTVKDMDTPESISFEYYDDSKLYWIILMFNNINNIYDEWPKSTEVIERRLRSKFGDIRNSNNKIHHYTHDKEKYDISATTYKIRMSESDNEKAKMNEFKPVSEYEYMMEQNEKNRKIRLLRPMHITNFILTLQETYNLYG